MEEKEKKEEKVQNFKTVQNPSTYKDTFKNEPQEKTKIGFTKSILLPFFSGVVGCSLVIGTCFGIPSIRSQLLGAMPKTESTTNTEASRIC